jgi:hypothetical protein
LVVLNGAKIVPEGASNVAFTVDTKGLLVRRKAAHTTT